MDIDMIDAPVVVNGEENHEKECEDAEQEDLDDQDQEEESSDEEGDDIEDTEDTENSEDDEDNKSSEFSSSMPFSSLEPTLPPDNPYHPYPRPPPVWSAAYNDWLQLLPPHLLFMTTVVGNNGGRRRVWYRDNPTTLEGLICGIKNKFELDDMAQVKKMVVWGTERCKGVKAVIDFSVSGQVEDEWQRIVKSVEGGIERRDSAPRLVHLKVWLV